MKIFNFNLPSAMKKPTLGAIADFSFIKNCPVGKYALGICEGLQEYFDIRLLDLGLCDLRSSSNILFEKHIIDQVKNLDVVDIHLEFGLFGKDIDVVEKRLYLIFERAKKIVVTVHSAHLDGGGFEQFYRRLFSHLKLNIMPNKEVIIMVNNVGDKEKMENAFHIDRCVCMPLVYFTQSKINESLEGNVLKNKSKIHDITPCKPNDDSIFIGLFGFINSVKDIPTAIEALARLDGRYKLIIAGSIRPMSLKCFEKDSNVVAICETIKRYEEASGFIDRIVFLDDLDDELFWKLMSSVDFVVLNYLETLISSSSVMSQALQLGKKIIASNTTPFNNLKKFYENCFEQIDCGNYFQLRQKILYFDESKIENLKRCNEKWNMFTMAKVYKDFYCGALKV